ncbi:XrtA/PEP-CTERM system TPR-repeat protein PrsT [Arenibaculum pallidiluteum]|uniref:XrtA/PEP-CTERM system TPR-repeat protein PrsT n=1 Tax=Arenibaculum pallidiluteum TaxID=2812559 RepID=UPI001A965BC9|nr:XrtA/PEP-CTERM system TPR-repeat protein PrsT [Arenibaculum pallidiluteum]
MRIPPIARILAVSSLALLAAGHAEANDPERSRRFLREAVQELDDGKVQAAVIQLRNALQQDPENLDARLLLGRIHLQNSDAPAAEKELRRVWEGRRGDEIEILFGRALVGAGKPEEVFKVVGIGARKPEDARAKMMVRGDAHVALREFGDARTQYEAILAEEPRDVPARLALARLLFGLGDPQAAEAQVEKLLALEPGSLEALLMKGEIDMAVGRLHDAKAALDKAAGIAPDHVGVKLAQGRLAIQMNDVPGAETRAREVLARQPENAMAKYLLATALTANSRFREADSLLTGIQPLVQSFAPAQLLEGVVKFQLEQYAQAERALSRYAEALPHNIGARRMQALTQIRMGNLRSAADTLEKLLADYPGDVPALQLMAGVRMREGDADAAAKAYERIAASGDPGAARQAQNVLTLLGMGGKAENGGGLDDRISREVVTVLELVRTQDLDGALERIRALRKEDPENLVMVNLEGSVRWAQGDREGGRKLIEGALARNPSFFAALDNLDRFDTAEGNTGAIERRMREAVARDPADERMVLRLAEWLSRQQRTGEATELLDGARRSMPTSAAVRTALVGLARQAGRPADAAVLADELMGIALIRPKVYADAGEAFMTAGDAAKAAEAFGRLAEAEPQSLSARLMQARAQLVAGKPAEARQTLDAARRIAPGNSAISRALVDLAMRDGRTADAAAYVEALAPHNPTEASRLRADLAFRANKPEAAVETMRRTFEEKPTAQAAIDLAFARVRAGQPDAAAEGLRAWLSKAPADKAVRMQLAEILLSGGRFDAAAAEYRVLVAESPKDAALLNNLAWAEHERGNPEAVRIAEQASVLAPNAPDVVDTHGWILVRTGRVEQGIEKLRKAAAAAPDRADIQYHLAVALKLSGKPQEARSLLEKVMATGRSFPSKQDAEALLAQLRS